MTHAIPPSVNPPSRAWAARTEAQSPIPLWQMTAAEFKAWLKRHQITGLAAAAAQKKRRGQIRQHTHETGLLDDGLTDGAQPCTSCGAEYGQCDCPD